jgi:hypothetical protein
MCLPKLQIVYLSFLCRGIPYYLPYELTKSIVCEHEQWSHIFNIFQVIKGTNSGLGAM